MPVAAAIAGAAVIGGATSLIEGGKAAKAEKNSAAAQIAEQRREYDQNRDDLAVGREVGNGALGKLATLYGVPTAGSATGAAASGVTGYNGDAGYSASPGFQFQLDQGIKAAQRTAAARGTFNSGGFTKAITRYATGAAASDFDNYTSRLAQLAGVGQSATNATVQAGQNSTNQISQAQQNAGNAQASSYANTGSAINGTVNNLAASYLYSRGGAGGVTTPAPTSRGGYDPSYNYSWGG